MSTITIGNKELHGKVKIGDSLYTPQQISGNLSISQLTSEEIILGTGTSGGTISPLQLSTYYEFKDNLSSDIKTILEISSDKPSAEFLNHKGEWKIVESGSNYNFTAPLSADASNNVTIFIANTSIAGTAKLATDEEIKAGIITEPRIITPSQLSASFEMITNLSGDINKNLGIDTSAENVSAYFLNKNGEWIEQKSPSAIVTDEGILEFSGIKATVVSEDGTLIIGE